MKNSVKFGEYVWFQLSAHGLRELNEMTTDFKKRKYKELKKVLFEMHIQDTLEGHVKFLFPVPEADGWCKMELRSYSAFIEYASAYDCAVVDHGEDFIFWFEDTEGRIYLEDPRK